MFEKMIADLDRAGALDQYLLKQPLKGYCLEEQQLRMRDRNVSSAGKSYLTHLRDLCLFGRKSKL
jgi:hypothetical protein